MVKSAPRTWVTGSRFSPDLFKIKRHIKSFGLSALTAVVSILVLTGATSVPDGGPFAALARQSSTDLTCVPYARLLSGIELSGDAWSWWDRSEGRYQRGHQPTAGAILVLGRSDRLYHGHLAVVSQVIGPRQILVDHANWVPGLIITNQPVVDVSPQNDWSMPRFYNLSAGVYGAVYPAHGFIYAKGQPDQQAAVQAPANLELLSWVAAQ